MARSWVAVRGSSKIAKRLYRAYHQHHAVDFQVIGRQGEVEAVKGQAWSIY